jgi:hypothetical protein
MIVNDEHHDEDDDRDDPGGGAFRRIRLPNAGCRRLARAQRQRAEGARDRQGEDDEVVEALRVFRQRHGADAAGRYREPTDAVRDDGEDEEGAQNRAEEYEQAVRQAHSASRKCCHDRPEVFDLPANIEAAALGETVDKNYQIRIDTCR